MGNRWNFRLIQNSVETLGVTDSISIVYSKQGHFLLNCAKSILTAPENDNWPKVSLKDVFSCQ